MDVFDYVPGCVGGVVVYRRRNDRATEGLPVRVAPRMNPRAGAVATFIEVHKPYPIRCIFFFFSIRCNPNTYPPDCHSLKHPYI